MSTPKILIVGGTGRVGTALVKALRPRDVHLRILSRQPNQDASAGGIEYASADLLDPVAVKKALEGIDKVFLLNAVTAEELTQSLIVYNLARQLRIRQIVYLSVFRAEHFKDLPHFAPKLAVEDALRTFDLPFTVLRPSYFFQNDESLRPALTGPGIYSFPLGSVGVSAVDARDIAEAAAITLTTAGHEGKTYNLVGPEVLSGPRMAAIWTEALGREIRYPGEDLEGFEEQMRQWAPAWTAFDIRLMFQAYLERGQAAWRGRCGSVHAAARARATALRGFRTRDSSRLAEMIAVPRRSGGVHREELRTIRQRRVLS